MARATDIRPVPDPVSRRTGSPEQQVSAQAQLQRMPRDASATRLRDRDAVDGRPRRYLRTFGLSRIRFREMALLPYPSRGR